jgi:excisionase family DNA binding protein
MQQQISAPRLNNPREQAAQMGCSLRTLQNLCAKRLVPYYKLGRLTRFDPAAVHAALKRLEIKAR